MRFLYIFIFSFLLSGCENWLHHVSNIDLKPDTNALLYKISIEGVEESVVLDELYSASKLKKVVFNKPSTQFALQKRIEADKILFLKILHKHGYFDSKIDVKIKDSKTSSNKKNRLKITFKIKTYSKYTIDDISIEISQKERDAVLKNLDSIKITKLSQSKELNLEEVQNARNHVLLYFQNLGYPFVQTLTPIGHILSREKKVKIIFPIRLGPKIRFGKIRISGNKKIKNEFILNRIQWRENDRYSQKKVNETISELMKTQIISQAKIYPEPPQAQNSNSTITSHSTPIHVQVEEPPVRSISLGARYSTSTSFGGQVLWNHKNLFGGGESLEISARSAIRERIAQIALIFPDFINKNTSLHLRQQYLKEKTRSYKTNVLGSYIDINYKLSKHLKLILGFLYETIKTTSFSEDLKNFKFSVQQYGVNTGFVFDYANDFLNPTKGFKVSSILKPYWSHKDKNSNIIDWTSQGSIYLPIIQDQFENTQFVVASNLKVGMIIMKDFKNEAVPNRRFYSGGPNSIRSYGYQKIGPMDKNGIPLGGRSLTEWTIELRSQFTDKIGAVAFFEAGTVMKNGSPILTGAESLYGAGLGLRYFSGMGPIRFDLGFPLKRRSIPGNTKPLDAPFQVVISIGQAF